jgi:hypothetical protein
VSGNGLRRGKLLWPRRTPVPSTNPARRPARRLSLDQVCREEYDAHVQLAYLTVETDCCGHLLTREAQAAGIHPITLFSGPASRARKHASPELRSWWARHGRLTYEEWRHAWMGRESDRKAAARPGTSHWER